MSDIYRRLAIELPDPGEPAEVFERTKWQTVRVPTDLKRAIEDLAVELGIDVAVLCSNCVERLAATQLDLKLPRAMRTAAEKHQGARLEAAAAAVEMGVGVVSLGTDEENARWLIAEYLLLASDAYECAAKAVTP